MGLDKNEIKLLENIYDDNIIWNCESFNKRDGRYKTRLRFKKNNIIINRNTSTWRLESSLGRKLKNKESWRHRNL